MNFWVRLAIIAFWPLAAAVFILVDRSGLDALPPSAVESIVVQHRWLEVVSVMYIANYLVAWKFADSWPISMFRMLIFAVVAYLAISDVVNVFGDNRELSWQILGFETAQDSVLISQLRSRIGAWMMALVMSLVCIGIGFEKIQAPRES